MICTELLRVYISNLSTMLVKLSVCEKCGVKMISLVDAANPKNSTVAFFCFIVFVFCRMCYTVFLSSSIPAVVTLFGPVLQKH